MICIEEGRRRTIVYSDDETFDDNNPLFGQFNGAPRCGIAIHVTPTKKTRNKSDGTDTQYLLQGKCKVLQKNMTHVCLDCADTDAVKNMKCGSATLRHAVLVLHSICIAHMTFSDKYITIKSCLYIHIYYAINASLLLIQV